MQADPVYHSAWIRHVKKVVTVLVVIGLVSAFSADLIKVQVVAKTASIESGYSLFVEDLSFPFSWKLATFLGLVCITGSGVLALFVEDLRRVGRLTILAFCIMQGWMLLHSLFAFYEGFSPFEIISFKGPAVWWSFTLVFVGLDRDRWKILTPIIYAFSFTATLLALNAIFSQQFSSRIESLRILFGYMPLILWTAPLLFVTLFGDRKWRMAVGSLPFVTFLLCALVSATRSWILLSSLYLPILWYIGRSARDRQSKRNPTALLLCLLCLLSLGGWFLFHSKVSTAINLLSSRLYEDTRSGQYKAFFSQVSILQLLVGSGPRGTWVWAGQNFTSIDGSFILILFNGGLPLLWSYVIIMLRPAVLVLKRTAPTADMVVAGVLLVWGGALTGLSIYSTPDISFSHNLLCLYAGRCLSSFQEGSYLPCSKETV